PELPGPDPRRPVAGDQEGGPRPVLSRLLATDRRAPGHDGAGQEDTTMTQRVPIAPPEAAAPMAPQTIPEDGAVPPVPAEAPAEAGGAEQTGQQEAFVGRLFESGLGALDLLAVSLGLQLGLYRALADGGPATPAELAACAGIHARYAREWLEQQAVTDVLEVVADPGDPEGRRYRLPAGRAAVLLDEESLFYLAPVARMIDGAGKLMPRLLEAYRTG